MSEEREFYAPTVDEAVAKAATDLGVPSEELEFKVLDEGSTGFLGIGARDARIAVEVEGTSAPTSIVQQEPELSAPLSSEETETAVAEPEQSESTATVEDAQSSDERAEEEEIEAPQELLSEVNDLVSSLLTAMDFTAGVDVYDAGRFIAVDVAPENTALFIGQKGETIDALQYIVNVAIYRERPFVKRVVLDAEGYRQRRVEAIQGMAHRTARRAVREHRPVELPPMNSSERRVVHLFLRDNPGVTTRSEGSGDNRRVTVSPV